MATGALELRVTDTLDETGDKKFEGEDTELLGLAGAALYDALGPLRTAAC